MSLPLEPEVLDAPLRMDDLLGEPGLSYFPEPHREEPARGARPVESNA